MIFTDERFEQVKRGEKTQTCRVNLGNYTVGKSYACQPGRGKRGEGRILITDIALDENVTTITPYDAKAEGFADAQEFLTVWTEMHDKPMYYDLRPTVILRQCAERAKQYPERYRAWKLTFVYIPPEG